MLVSLYIKCTMAYISLSKPNLFAVETVSSEWTSISQRFIPLKHIFRTLINCGVSTVLQRSPCNLRSWDSIIGTATGQGLDDRGFGVRVLVGSRIFSSPRRADRFWDPPNLVSNRYRELLPRG
jgi:hypothetical protein